MPDDAIETLYDAMNRYDRDEEIVPNKVYPEVTEVTSLCNISELLVQLGIFDTVLKASSAVKRGDVYVNRYRVADPKTTLMISGLTKFECPPHPPVLVMGRVDEDLFA